MTAEGKHLPAATVEPRQLYDQWHWGFTARALVPNCPVEPTAGGALPASKRIELGRGRPSSPYCQWNWQAENSRTGRT